LTPPPIYSRLYGVPIAIIGDLEGVFPFYPTTVAIAPSEVEMTIAFVGDIAKMAVAERSAQRIHTSATGFGSEPLFTIDRLGSVYRWYYPRGIAFDIDESARRIDIYWDSPTTHAAAALFLCGHIFSFILRRRGIYCLHASCLAVDDRAFALVGDSGAGKSTTATALVDRGCRLVTDDVLPIVPGDDGCWYAIPGYPGMKLQPDIIQQLGENPTDYPLLLPERGKHYYYLRDEKIVTQPIPLKAIYFLDRRQNLPTAPIVLPHHPHNAAVQAIRQSYGKTLLDRAGRETEFQTVSAIVSQVSLRRVVPHTEIVRLEDLCRAILSDFQKIG
jgi:hypothetical protein